MDKCYVVLIGEYEQSIHRVFTTLEKAEAEYKKLKTEFIESYSDLKHFDTIEAVNEQANTEFHIKYYFLE